MKRIYQKGFTLVELLVVIAVLGVLAAGVLTAINPLKRINQANDSKIKNDIGQIATAEQAYFITNQVYAADVITLKNSLDLKTEPKVPPAGTVPYTVTLKPSGCTTACTDVAVSALINDQSSGGTIVWCWDSTNNVAKQSATAPVAGTATCP